MTEKQKKELQKLIENHDGRRFSELESVVLAQQSREYPDFGGGVPEDVYYVLGVFNVHTWKNRRGNETEILTAVVANEKGDEFEVAFASFCKREWDFVKFNRETKEYDKVECNPLLPFYPSLSQRTKAVSEIKPMTAIRIKRARGHFDNPNNTRVFDFNYTWVEKA